MKAHIHRKLLLFSQQITGNLKLVVQFNSHYNDSVKIIP